jgi:hypothetical protein
VSRIRGQVFQYNNEIRTPTDVSALPQKVKQVNYVPRKDMTLCRFSFPGPIQGRSFLRKQAISLDFVEEISKMTNTLLQDLTPISFIARPDPDFLRGRDQQDDQYVIARPDPDFPDPDFP